MDAVRGPSLGTKLLILMSFALVVIPWFSYLYLSEMEDFLVDSQANAQLLAAEGISTLLNGRTDLFTNCLNLPRVTNSFTRTLCRNLSVSTVGTTIGRKSSNTVLALVI